ncbi:MAG: tetratricopeptide repeat protein [Acidobacteriota bacterium]
MLAFLSAPIFADNPATPTAAQWREDLAYLVDMLERVHPNLYARIDREIFADEARAIHEEIPELSPVEITVRLMQLVALVQDGHTSLEPLDPAGFGRWFPVRFYRFSDGIFVTAVAAEHGTAAGARVTRIGSLPAEEAWQRTATLRGSDNAFGSANSAAFYLSSAAALRALGVNDSEEVLEIEVQRAGSDPETVRLEAIDTGYNLDWQFWGEIWGPGSESVEYVTGVDSLPSESFRDPESDLPLHLRNRTAYWFTYDEKTKLFYLQINFLGDSRSETFADFHARLWKAVDEAEIDLFVLDIRYNIGGNGDLVKRFVHEFIKRDEINRAGTLYTIVGRTTFSAGVMMAAAMDRHTETVFVGEPMGAYYKHYGDGTSFRLPHSGLRVWCSTIYHQLDAYVGDREVMSIQLPAPFSSADYFGKRDPALDAILASRERPPLAQLFREQGAEPALEAYRQQLAEYDGVSWWAPFTMRELDGLGDELREAGKWEDALAAYQLNIERHPDQWLPWHSLGHAYQKQGKFDQALESYERALEIDPYNNLAPFQREAIEELRQQKQGG